MLFTDQRSVLGDGEININIRIFEPLPIINDVRLNVPNPDISPSSSCRTNWVILTLILIAKDKDRDPNQIHQQEQTACDYAPNLYVTVGIDKKDIVIGAEASRQDQEVNKEI